MTSLTPTPCTPPHETPAVRTLEPDTMQRILTWADATAYLERITDTELADLLEQEVWATLPVMSPASDVVQEAIDRLRGTQAGAMRPAKRGG